jgi:hypothetical protein
MAAWYAAIPVVGELLTRLGGAIDELVTSDEERLALRARMTASVVPLLTAVVEAEKQANDLRAKIAEFEARSEDRFVRWRRPVISILGTIHGCAGLWLYIAGVVDYAALVALLTFGGALGGLDITSRGLEKTMEMMRGARR